MTELSDNTYNVRDLTKKEPKLPEHKKLFDEFIREGMSSYYIMGGLADCRPDLRIHPFISGNDKIMYVAVDHASELAKDIDWLGGDLCDENIAFSIKPDGSLQRIIEITPSIAPQEIDSPHISANLGSEKSRDFVNYVMGYPGKDIEGILPFLEINDEERQEIASLHRRFRRRHFVANKALVRSGLDITALH